MGDGLSTSQHHSFQCVSGDRGGICQSVNADPVELSSDRDTFYAPTRSQLDSISEVHIHAPYAMSAAPGIQEPWQGDVSFISEIVYQACAANQPETVQAAWAFRNSSLA